jgi:competence protein ComEC
VAKLDAIRPDVIKASLALLAGVLVVQWLPVLPALEWSLLPAAAAGVIGWRWPALRVFAWLLLGVAWALWRGGLAMQARLPAEFEGRDIVVEGRIAGLPDARVDASRFLLRIESAKLDGRPFALHGLIQSAWYDEAPPLPPCSRWHLLLRLKRPRGLINPGIADSERSALQRGIVATGYVRADPANAPIGGVGWCVDGLRARLADGIASRIGDAHDAALLRAFSVGDTRALEPKDWDVARANGVSHLIAISGFHVGVAAAFGAGLIALVYGCFPKLALRLPRVQAQAGGALVIALAYGVLAGLALPTVRTLLMIAVVVFARCSKRHSGGGQALALAMMAMLLADPLAVLAAGFWLSFVGVAFLMLCLTTHGRGLMGFVRELTIGQLVMTLALLPLTLWFFGEASLVGALSNLIAVPVISFLIVPLALAGILGLLLWPPLAMAPLWIAAHVAHAQWWLLEQAATWPGAQQYLPSVQPWALVLAVLGALWLLAPRGAPARWLGGLLFLPLLFPPQARLPEHAFEAWVLDVGQGLSVVVRTRQHVLVYDTGARYPSGFDLGDAVVVPSLHAIGVRRLDMLMVSHGDNDHAGGAGAVVAAYRPAQRYAGEPQRMSMPMPACVAGQSWRWDGVDFRVLAPASSAGKGNDRSCVLLVDGGGDRFLLTGDITRRDEPAVADALPAAGHMVLLVPHHGSKTSSGEAFIHALQPGLALVSTGWRNRFGHPSPVVAQRYAQAGVPLLDTAVTGAIHVLFPADARAQVLGTERARQRRYWRE